jgi:diguanylate cyclase (GGDEF)-like protein
MGSDARTGLHDAREFREALEREVARAHCYRRQLTLMVLDVDDFKSLNDRLGHAAGDVALGRLADAMRGAFRSYDTLARYGGDEFAVLLPETDADDATAIYELLCSRLADTASEPFGRIVLSCGIAELETQEEGRTLFRRADDALYRNKRGGDGPAGGTGVREPRRPKPPTLGASQRPLLDPGA